MKLDNEMNFILKEQPMWFCKLSIQEKIDIAMLLQRYAEQLNILPVSKCEGIERRVLLLAFLYKYIQVRDSQKPNAMDIEILDNFLRQQ